MTDSHLRVSVIVPTFNRAHLVCEAIDSLLAQTRVPDEIIVVDDGSTDNTQAILQKYHGSIRLIKNEKNERSSARNTGLASATGDLIAFLDDDDTLTVDSIQTRASFLEENPAFGVVYGDVRITDFDGVSQGSYSKVFGITAPSGEVFGDLILHNCGPIHAFMIRKTCFSQTGGFKDSLSYMEDFQLWLRLAVDFRFHYVNKVVGDYRFHPGQTTSTKQRLMLESEIRVREEAFQYPVFAALPAIQKARAYSVQGTRCFQLGDKTAARQWYLRAIRTAPTNVRPYLLLVLTSVTTKTGLERISRLYRRLRTLGK